MAGHGGDGHGGGHGHHGPCSCEHDHDDDESLERGTLFSLYLKVDSERVRCLNESHDGSAKTIFKPWHERLDKEKVSLLYGVHSFFLFYCYNVYFFIGVVTLCIFLYCTFYY